MKKPAFCICENQDTDQLHNNCLCFRYVDSAIALLNSYKKSEIFCCCTARFMLDLVKNTEDRFSHDALLIQGMANTYGYVFTGYVRNARELQQDRARGKLFEWVADDVFERPTYKSMDLLFSVNCHIM